MKNKKAKFQEASRNTQDRETASWRLGYLGHYRDAIAWRSGICYSSFTDTSYVEQNMINSIHE